MQKKIYIAVTSIILCYSCKDQSAPPEDVSNIGVAVCQVQPHYVARTGLNPKLAALSTSEKKVKGLVLVEFNATTGSRSAKSWQDPSWTKFGWMASIVSDDAGNSYVSPAPVVSVLDNPTNKQNIIYKVDGRTAEMKPFIDLPITDSITHENPYGLLGLYFDCSSRLLYASSIAGSDKENENGVIYAINPKTAEIVDQFKGHDAMGLCVLGITGEKRLFFGSSRTSNIYSVALNEKGAFEGQAKEEFSLDGAGPRGDDKARRIRMDKAGALIIQGIEFNYNLTAASEKIETPYRMSYNKNSKQWEQIPF